MLQETREDNNEVTYTSYKEIKSDLKSGSDKGLAMFREYPIVHSGIWKTAVRLHLWDDILVKLMKSKRVTAEKLGKDANLLEVDLNYEKFCNTPPPSLRDPERPGKCVPFAERYGPDFFIEINLIKKYVYGQESLMWFNSGQRGSILRALEIWFVDAQWGERRGMLAEENTVFHRPGYENDGRAYMQEMLERKWLVQIKGIWYLTKRAGKLKRVKNLIADKS